MAYALGTTETQVRWYTFFRAGDAWRFELHEVLDVSRVTYFASKDDAKAVARAAGLSSWRYVRF